VRGVEHQRSSRAFRDVADRIDDVTVRTAAAEIAAHPFADRRRIGWTTLGEQGDGGDDLTGRTEPALKAVVFEKGRFHRVQFLAGRESLDGW